LVFGGSLVDVKATFSVVEGAVPCAGAKVVVWQAWCASPAAAMVVGASGATSTYEACIWCSLHRRWSCRVLLVVGGRSFCSSVGAVEGSVFGVTVGLPSSGASMWFAPKCRAKAMPFVGVGNDDTCGCRLPSWRRCYGATVEAIPVKT
jgi:hypothetical protein